MKDRHQISVLGQSFQVRSPGGAAHVQAVAEEVNRRIEALRQATRVTGGQPLAVMVALDLADELLRARQREGDLREAVAREIRALLERLDNPRKARQDRR